MLSACHHWRPQVDVTVIYALSAIFSWLFNNIAYIPSALYILLYNEAYHKLYLNFHRRAPECIEVRILSLLSWFGLNFLSYERHLLPMWKFLPRKNKQCTRSVSSIAEWFCCKIFVQKNLCVRVLMQTTTNVFAFPINITINLIWRPYPVTTSRDLSTRDN